MAQLILRPDSDAHDLHWIHSYWVKGVERVFFIYGVPEGVARGQHHHVQCQMGLVCVSGSVDIYIQTPSEDQHFQLDTPNQFLLLEPTDWRMMYNFSANAVLMVMADRTYHETTYIRSAYRPIPDYSYTTV